MCVVQSNGVCSYVVGWCAWRRLPCVQEHVFYGVIMQLDDPVCAVPWPCWYQVLLCRVLRGGGCGRCEVAPTHLCYSRHQVPVWVQLCDQSLCRQCTVSFSEVSSCSFECEHARGRLKLLNVLWWQQASGCPQYARPFCLRVVSQSPCALVRTCVAQRVKTVSVNCACTFQIAVRVIVYAHHPEAQRSNTSCFSLWPRLNRYALCMVLALWVGQ